MFNFKKEPDMEKEIRKAQRRREIKNKVNDAMNWINHNKEVLVIVIPAGIALFNGTVKFGRSISRNIALHQEKQIKELKIYDRSLGRYIDLKRPLKHSDMKTILERKENGERLANILMDMDLVK